MEPVLATYYGPDAARPSDAMVQWSDAHTLQLVLNDRTEQWRTDDPTFNWEVVAGKLRIGHGDPACSLILNDARWTGRWKEHLHGQRAKRADGRRVPMIYSVLVLIPFGLLVIAAAIYFLVLPWLSEKLVMSLPAEMEMRMGEAMLAGGLSKLPEDMERTKHLQAFADRLSLSPTFSLHLHVVKDPTMNAFAVSGGHIVVFTGLLDSIQDAGQLAALLAHEATHIEKRHSTRALVRSAAGRYTVAMILGRTDDLLALATAAGDDLFSLEYSRDFESEADTAGMRRLFLSGVDPHSTARMLELIDDESTEAEESTAFLRTHPLTKDRIALARNHADLLGRPPVANATMDSLFQHVQRHRLPAGAEDTPAGSR